MPDREYLPALRFDALTRLYDPLVAFTTRERAVKERLVDLAAPRDEDRVLDVGCGTATLALAIARRAPGTSISGVDADDTMLARGRTKARRAGVDLDLNQAMAQELPFPDDTFDLAVSSLFFHHLQTEDKLAVAREVRRVIKPGGRLAIADWGAPRDPLMRLASLGIRALDGTSAVDNLEGLLPQLLEQAGFDRVAERELLRTFFGSMTLLTARPG